MYGVNFKNLQLFVYKWHQNKKIVTREIEKISKVVEIWTSNAHKYLIWIFGRFLFFNKGRNTYEKSCNTFWNLRFKKKIF